jgi:hypothetical protein
MKVDFILTCASMTDRYSRVSWSAPRRLNNVLRAPAVKITRSAGSLFPSTWMDLKVAQPEYALSGWRVALFAALTLACAAAAVLRDRRKDILA